MRRYSYAVETRIEDATWIFTHYFHGSANDNEDMRAEIRGAMEGLLGAAAIYVEEDLARIAQESKGVTFPRQIEGAKP
jgi:hypothetical protein